MTRGAGLADAHDKSLSVAPQLLREGGRPVSIGEHDHRSWHPCGSDLEEATLPRKDETLQSSSFGAREAPELMS